MSRYLTAICLALTLGATVPGHAAWGDRDCTFGNAGVAQIPNRGYPDYSGTNDAFDLALEQDGNILARQGDLNNYAWLQRLGPNGTPLSIEFRGLKPPGQNTDSAVVPLGSGKILVPIGYDPVNGAVARLLQPGQLDTTFGNNGYTTVNGLRGTIAGPIVQPDGKIVIGSYWWDGVSSNSTPALARFNADGTPDLAFGTGGYVLAQPGLWFYRSIALQPDGKILVMGLMGTKVLTRHHANGALDTTFGSGGTVAIPNDDFYEVRVQSSGKILVTTEKLVDPKGLWITRYSVDGALETSRAVTVPSLPADQNAVYSPSRRHSIFLMPDDRVVIFGALKDPGDPYPGPAGAIVRLTADLMDDAHVRLDFTPSDLRVLPDGKLITLRGDWFGSTLRRLLGDSSPATCAPTTIAMTASPNPSTYGSPLTLTATVTATSGNPLGWVEFRREGAPVTQANVSGGVATTTYPYVPAGSHQLTATYYPSGSAHLESTSAPVSQVVMPSATINDPTANSADASPSLTFTVTLGGGASASTVTVNYATADQSAIAGTDYTATSGTLTFAPGETSKPIVVPVTPKSVPSPSKKLFLTLSNPSNASIARSTGVGTIVFASPGSLSLFISDAAVAEGYAGVALLGFTVSLSKVNAGGPVTVAYATANDTAIANTDYTATSGTLTFAPGQTQQWVMVPIYGNATVQANRSFFVNISNASAGVIAQAQAVGTIIDDDPAPVASQVPMYRLYSNGSKEHLYTTDANEYAVLPTVGWVAEGIAFNMFGSGGTYSGQYAVPLYRLYHPGILQHHWTSDWYEVTVLVAGGTWQYEGIPGYLLPAAVAGTTSLFRLSYPYPPIHLWTTDAYEKDVLSTQYGWTYEGVMGEVLP